MKSNKRENEKIETYNGLTFNSFEMNQIQKGLKSKVDVSIYAKPEYNWMQMQEIRWALEEKLNVEKLLNPKMEPYEMFQIRKKQKVS